MSQPESGSRSRQILSALADGEASEAEGADAFLSWREDAQTRATWHCYHLIGDVLRSEDLAAPAASQQRMLAALRERLAAEPVVLAPPAASGARAAAPAGERAAPAAANASAGGWLRAHWQAPVAMAAGFLAVIGGLQYQRAHEAGAARATIAQAQPAAAASVVAVAVATPVARVQAAALTRDQAEQIAPYVAAHRLSTMNAALQMPGGADVRNVSLVHPAQ